MSPELQLSKQIGFGESALRAVLDAMPRVEFEPYKRPQLYAVALHCSLTQFCGGCLAMAKSEHTAGIPVLLRAMFEGLVDLDNLLANADYHEHMQAADRLQHVKLWKSTATNPLLAGMERKYDIAANLAECVAELNDLKGRNRGPLHIDEKCRRANRLNEYASVYYVLCMDSHNNVTALVERHVSGSESEHLQVGAFGDGDQLVLARRVFQATGWMLESAEAIHKAFKTGYSFVPHLREIESMRGRIV
jgi:hypothetical protein